MTHAFPRISIIGLGKLGAPLLACFASKGFTVVGVDADEAKVKAVAEERAPVFEPELEGRLQAGADRIATTSDIEAAVQETDVTMIVVATPSEPGGGFSLRYVIPVCEAIGRALAEKDDFHLVVMTSTVMPGSMGGPIRSVLEQTSGKRCGHSFGLCYSPEFVALGSAIRDFLNPDFLLVGESDRRSGDLLESIYRHACDREAPVARMNWTNAELAKLSVNTFVTTKIAFANMLARICEALSGADVDVVTSAIGLDTRIGSKYLKGAISYGGPCFPRDNLALAALARRVDTPALIAEATDRTNRGDVRRLADRVLGSLPVGGTVGVLGLAYKPNTDVVEESAGLLLVETLAEEGADVVAYDPAANVSAYQVFDDEIRLTASLEECVRQADVVVVTTPWPEFRSLGAQLVERSGEPRTIIDCWRILDRDALAAVAEYVALGQSGEQELASEISA